VETTRRVDGAGGLGTQQLGVDGRRERGAQDRLNVQIGHEKDVAFVLAKPGKERGLAYPSPAVEDKELGLV
jgi:hypothetical protein